MSDSYPDTITDYDLSSYDTTKKPEKIAEIVDEWYRKFLSCEIKRERNQSVFEADPTVSSLFLIDMCSYLRTLEISEYYRIIFTTDYCLEGELRQIYKNCCRKLGKETEKRFGGIHIVFPIKWCVSYDDEKLYIR